jgi:hypothetical protein
MEREMRSFAYENQFRGSEKRQHEAVPTAWAAGIRLVFECFWVLSERFLVWD